jgi:hypothetical protein
MAQEQGMIEPFADAQVRDGVISYGVSSYGYDLRVANEFKIFTNVHSAIVDPKNFAPTSFVDYQGDVCVIPPNSFALARSVEYFRIPRQVLTICLGKSTYARIGLIVNPGHRDRAGRTGKAASGVPVSGCAGATAAGTDGATRAHAEAVGEAEPHGEVAAPASIEVSQWEKRGSAGMGRRRQPKTPLRYCPR